MDKLLACRKAGKQESRKAGKQLMAIYGIISYLVLVIHEACYVCCVGAIFHNNHIQDFNKKK
jgi:hypothetical protein